MRRPLAPDGASAHSRAAGGLQAGQLRGPEAEAASEQELQEAMFRRLKAAHQGQPRPGPYYARHVLQCPPTVQSCRACAPLDTFYSLPTLTSNTLCCRYLQWLREGLTPGEAYSERAALHAAAKCYLQARADALAAVATLRRDAPPAQQLQQAAGALLQLEQEHQQQLARAYQRLGQAYLAERRHEDRDCFQAARAFMQAAAELDRAGAGGSTGDAAATILAGEVQEGLQEASEQLTMVEIDQVSESAA